MSKINIIGTLCAISAGMFWGTTGTFVRLLSSLGLGNMDIAAIRNILSLIVIALILMLRNRKLFLLHMKDCWIFIVAGLVTNVLFSHFYFSTVTHSALSVASVLLYTSPVMVMLMALFLFKEALTFRKITACILALLGCFFVTGAAGYSGNVPSASIITGLLAALCFGLYSILSRIAINKGYRTLTIVFYTYFFAAIGVLIPADLPNIASTVSQANSIELLTLAGMAFCTTIFPYILYTASVEKCGASKSAIMSSTEPVVETIFGAVVFSEQIKISGVFGIILVISAIITLNMPEKTIFQRHKP